MCGVMAFHSKRPTEYHIDLLCKLIDESSIRGLHAFGFSYVNRDGELATRRYFGMEESIKAIRGLNPIPMEIICHNRYCTSGDWQVLRNNQPVVVGGKSLAFNGVISMGTKEEMEKEFHMELDTYNDGEVFLRRLKDMSADEFTWSMKGSFAGVWLDAKGIHAIRNERRPLWYFYYEDAVFVSSTGDIISRAFADIKLRSNLVTMSCTPHCQYDLRAYETRNM